MTTQEPIGFDPNVPNVARMYDYYLGGKDNFAADRDAAEKALAVAPELRVGAREGRRFLVRVVRFLAEVGIRQFIDIGCGLPTQGNVHQIVQQVTPGARVVYVDNDPVVIAHARALLESSAHTAVVQADVREPDKLLADGQLRALVDLDRPVAILLFSVLHVLPDDAQVVRIVAGLRDAMAPGSYLALSHAVCDLRPEATARLAALYQERMGSPGQRRQNLRSSADVVRYFDGLELVPPGLVYVNEWRPDRRETAAAAKKIWSFGGVGRKV